MISISGKTGVSFVFSGLLFFFLSLLVWNPLVANPLAGPFSAYCQRDYPKGRAQLDAYLAKNPEDFFAYYLRHFYIGHDKADTIKRLSAEYKIEPSPKDPFASLLFATALLESRHLNIDDIDKLLAFSATKPHLQSAQLVLQSSLAGIRGDTETQFDKIAEALERSPYLFPALLADVLSIEPQTDTQEKQREKYINWIKRVGSTSPYRAYLEILATGDKPGIAGQEFAKKLEKIFESCPIELRFRYAYGEYLHFLEQHQEAYDILSEIPVQHINYPAYFDVALAEVALSLGLGKQAADYLESAQRVPVYLSERGQKQVGKLKQAIQVAYVQEKFIERKPMVMSLLILIAIIAVLVLLSKWNKRRRRPTYGVVEDMAALGSGEKAAKKRIKYVVAAEFYSGDGFDELQAIDLINELSSQGLSVQFRKNVIGKGTNATVLFTIEAPESEIPKIRAIIKAKYP